MKSISLSNKANNTNPNDLQDMRDSISQSGTAGECLTLCFIGMVLFAMIIVLMMIAGCNTEQPASQYNKQSEATDTVALPVEEVSEAPEVSKQPEELETPSESTLSAQAQGETLTFEYNTYFTEERAPFSVEITNVLKVETLTGNDDAGNPREYANYVLAPGAQLAVINADMNDGSLTEGGQPHANWSVYKNPGDRIQITIDMEPLEITEDMEGIISNEGYSFILTFEFRG